MGDTQALKRIWAPTIESDAGCFIDKSHVGNCRPRIGGSDDVTKKCSAAAADCAVGTSKFVSSLRERLSSASPRFSACVVTSRQNKLFWPKVNLQNLDGVEENEPSPSALFFANQFFFENLSPHRVLCSVTLPCDQATKFLDNLAREEAKKKFYFFSDYVDSITLLPSVSRFVSLSDVSASISNNYRLTANIKSFSLSSASASNNEDGITSFIQKGKKLECLSLSNCSLRRVASNLLLEIQKTSIATLNLQGNDLGIEDDMTEDIIAALADLLKYNKFLLKLDLSYNHFTPKQLRILLNAFASSDTTLVPDDLPPEPEEEIIPIEDYVKRHLFLGGTESGSERDENDDEEDVEEDEEPPPVNGEPDEDDEHRRNSSDEEEDAEEDEEDNESSKSGGDNEDSNDVGNEDEDEEKEPKTDPQIAKKLKVLFSKLFREEEKARKGVISEYLRELLNVAQERIGGIRERKEIETQERVEQFCKRRSGWSQLEELNLRGNRLGDIGAIGIALILRDEVPLTSDEVEKIETTLREKNDVLLNALTKDRETTKVEEMKAFKSILLEEKRERQGFLQQERIASGSKEMNSSFGVRSSETRKSQVRRTSSIVFTNMDDKGEEDHSLAPPEEDEEEEEVRTADEGAEKEEVDGEDEGEDVAAERETELEEREPWSFAVRPTKKGLNSIRVLDLGGCEIGSRGLKKISVSLESNKKLDTLILRNNTKFAVLLQSVEGIEADDEEEEASSIEKKVEVPHYISPGFESFSSMLKGNKFLKHLDLGFCQLSPDSITVLSSALKENSTLEYLNLEGNRIGEPLGTSQGSQDIRETRKTNGSPNKRGDLLLASSGGVPVEETPSGAGENENLLPNRNFSCLLQLLQALRLGGSIKHLFLNQMDLSQSFQKDEAIALGELSCKQLISLQLNAVGFTATHMTLWYEALEEQGVEITSLRSLQLERNEFAGTADGEVIGQVVGRLNSSLVDISLESNHKLSSSGVAAVAAALCPLSSSSPVLRSFNANHTGISSFCLADGSAVIPARLLSSLRYLSLADMSCGTVEELVGWITYLQSHAVELLYLSMWSRHLDMEVHLEPFSPLIDALQELLYIDFGVLLRFDVQPADVMDTLGSIERRLTARRLQKCFKDVPLVFSVEPGSEK